MGRQHRLVRLQQRKQSTQTENLGIRTVNRQPCLAPRQLTRTVLKFCQFRHSTELRRNATRRSDVRTVTFVERLRFRLFVHL